jgi:hypothetical protein
VKPTEAEHEWRKEEGEEVESPDQPPKPQIRPGDQKPKWNSSREGGDDDACRESRGPQEEDPRPWSSEYLDHGLRGRRKLRHEEEQGQQRSDDQYRAGGADED